MGTLLSKVKATTTSTTTPSKPEKMAPVAMTYLPKAQTTFKPPLIANENAYLGDVATRYAHLPSPRLSPSPSALRHLSSVPTPTNLS